ncbi:hypothetical protein ABMA70_15825 [Halobacteriovorax sp. XZX-3]
MSIENKLEQAVVHLIDKSIAGIDNAVDFLSAELPVYIEQLLTWYAVKGFIGLAISIGVLWLGIHMVRKVFIGLDAFKAEDKENEWFEWGYGKSAEPTLKAACFAIAGLVLVFSGLLGTLDNLWEPIQIMVAPHVWLVEYAAQLKAIASN